MESNEKKKNGTETAEIIELIARETEQVVAKACEAARREAEQELEKALRDYEQKTRQIVLKIREEAKARTAEIAGRLGEAIMMNIEKSSTEAIADAVAGFGKKAEILTQNLKETTGKEVEQALAGLESGTRKFATEGESAPAPDNRQQAKETAGAANSDFELEVGQELTGVTEDEADEETQQDSEEFEHWLTH